MEMKDLEYGSQQQKLSPNKTASKQISWENIMFSVGDKQILKGVSGTIRPYGLCAIMGPSGAGKSSLLNIIAGRLRTQGKKKVSGNIFVNSRKIHPYDFRKKIAYVMQEDALFATQTPREALEFSAALRLPQSITATDRKKLVDNLLVELSLTKCADTIIGSVLIPGISGGEKKRVAIGVELISNPDILFLDEPTSGLDSFSAFNVIKILKRLCASGKTIITTIHQPSSEIFQLFDEVLLLAHGKIIYNGTRSYMTTYFENQNYVCPDQTNPADFVMYKMQEASVERIKELAKIWNGWPGESISLRNGENMKVSTGTKEHLTAKSRLHGKRVGFLTELYWLTKREGKNLLRDKKQIRARVGSTIFLNMLVGVVFFGSANWSGVNTSDVADVLTKTNAHYASIFQILMGAMMGLMQATMLGFPLERPMFLREYATGTYNAPSYFLSKTLVEIPVSLLQTSLVFLCSYWTIGFSGNFFTLTLIGTLLGMVAASQSLVVGASVDSVQSAMQMTPILFLPQILFSGVFVPISDIPVYLRWIQYICSLKYAINLVTIAEFHDIIPVSWPEENTDPYYMAIYGCSAGDISNGICNTSVVKYNENAIFPRNNINPNSAWEYVFILVGILVVFRALAIMALIQKGKSS